MIDRPRRWNRAVLALVAWMAFTSISVWTSAARAAELSLLAAVKQGAAEVYINGRGYSTGDALQLRVRKKVAGTLNIKVEPGTVLVPIKGQCQSMVAFGVKWHWSAQGKWNACSEIVLDSSAEQVFILEGYCRDAKLPSPKSANYFTLDKTDEASLKVLVEGKRNGCTAKIIQAAIWIARDRVQDTFLAANFHCNEREIQAARSLLEVVRATAEDVIQRRESALREVLAELRISVEAGGGIELSELLKQFGVTKEAEVTADARVSGPLGFVGVEVSKGQRFAVLDERNGRVLVAGNAGVIPVRGWIAADKVVVREMVDTESDRDAAAERVGANVGRLRDAVLEVLDKVD